MSLYGDSQLLPLAWAPGAEARIAPDFNLNSYSAMLHCQPLQAPVSNRKRSRHATIAEACSSCRQSKVKCDTVKPCSRCVKHGRQDACVDWRAAEATSDARSSSPEESEQTPKESKETGAMGGTGAVKFARNMATSILSQKKRAVRKCIANACTACRQSKVKCDETKPCSRCIKQNMQDSCTTSSPPPCPTLTPTPLWSMWSPYNATTHEWGTSRQPQTARSTPTNRSLDVNTEPAAASAWYSRHTTHRSTIEGGAAAPSPETGTPDFSEREKNALLALVGLSIPRMSEAAPAQ